MRRLPLRSRLALLTAAAVAVAVAAAAFACWFITRDQLVAQLDSTLTSQLENQLTPRGGSAYIDSILARCQTNAPSNSNLPPGLTSVQIIDSHGQRCVGAGAVALKVQHADVQVAEGTRDAAKHNARTDSGQHVRAVTLPLLQDNTRTNLAITVSRPLDEIDRTLDHLAWLLLAVAGIGVVGAATAGLWVARTGLRPVDRLTEAVEHVAATEDLNVRLPVEGEDEIARLGQSFNAMTAALASSRDRQRQLIADAGHELRTPLTSLRTNIELLERSEATGRPLPPEDRRELLASVKAQMTELAALIGDLQELNRPDSAAPSLTVVPLHEIAGTALRRARLRGPGLTIGADLAPWYVRGEAAALERAIVNLLDNAVKFSPPSGAVDVALHEGRLTVRDHGPGIPAEELPHVFERFWRSPTARSLPGSGLGLSIVARTVQQAGGTITLAPAEGGGTLATVQLPGAPTAPPETLPDT
ncbi:sensor histidine kinase [Streptomyces sp. NPDC004031]